MVGQWHRLDPGPVLHAVYPCLGSSEAVLHPWNTERGEFDILKNGPLRYKGITHSGFAILV